MQSSKDKTLQRIMDEAMRYREQEPMPGMILGILSWFDHQWPQYLRRRAQDLDRLETQALLQRLGMGSPPWDPEVPDWRLALHALDLGHPPEVISRVLELGYRMQFHGMGEMEIAVELVCWAMEGDHEGIDSLAGLQILSCPTDWKNLSPWSPYAGLQILSALEDYFSQVG